MRLAHRDVVGEEHHVHLGALGGARDLGVVLEIDAGIGLRLRVPPRRDVMAGGIEEGAEPELLAGSAHDAKSPQSGTPILEHVLANLNERNPP